MARNTERLNLAGGQWAEVDQKLNTKALTLALEAIREQGTVTHPAIKEMIVASVIKWSFSDVVSLGVLDYEVEATHYNDLANHVLGLYLAVGGASQPIEGDDEGPEEKKD